MTKIRDIYDFLNALAPVSLKMDFDNVGLLVGDYDAEAGKCLLALDITDEVIQEAKSIGAELIVSHHPLIFGAIKSVTADDLTGRKIIELIKNDISAICMHTNLDIAQGGVNDALMSALGANVQGFLELSGKDAEGNEVGCGRVGELKSEIGFAKFLSICKKALNTGGLRYHDAGKKVKRLAVMGGAGGSCIALAKSMGCDTYVTSDIKYNGFLDAKELGVNLIDADHFCTENVIIPVLAQKLSEEFIDTKFIVSSVHKQTVRFF